jgi:hypothetical protein
MRLLHAASILHHTGLLTSTLPFQQEMLFGVLICIVHKLAEPLHIWPTHIQAVWSCTLVR